MKILHVLSMTKNPSGGVGTYIKNIYESIDKANYQFELLICSDERQGDLVDFCDNEGITIHYLPSLAISNYFAIKRGMKKFFSEHDYDIVEIHVINMAFLCQKYIKRLTKAKLIYHGHATRYSLIKIRAIRNYILCLGIERYGDAFFACSDEAYSALFGKRKIAADKKYVITNPMKFVSFDNINQGAIRKELNIDSTQKIVLSIGRLTGEKNCFRMLDIFEGIKREHDEYQYVIAGGGGLKDELVKYCQDKNIPGVTFLGFRNDVYDIINDSDVIIIASLFEGLNIAAVEAQMFGVPVVMADTLPGVVKFNSNVIRLSLDDDNTKWQDSIIALAGLRVDGAATFKSSVFDIDSQIIVLQDKYQEIVGKK